MIVFRIKLIGGPFDGSPVAPFRDDGEDHVLPEQLLVGRCCNRSHHPCGCALPLGGVTYWDAAKRVLDGYGLPQYVRIDAWVTSLGRGVAEYVHSELDVEVTGSVFAGAGSN